MRVLIDTSTMIAAMLSDHPHHAESQVWISQAKSGIFEFFASAHSIAEVYAVLTRLPRSPRITPNEALQLLQDNVSSVASVVTLSGDEYFSLVARLAQLNIPGGAIYDGIIAKAAELANLDHLLTLNVAHFQKVWPTGASRIVSPQTFPAP